MTTRPPLALTMGEPGGIGPEITIKSWGRLAASGAADGPTFYLIGDADYMAAQAAELGAHLTRIETPEEAATAFRTSLPVLHCPLGGDAAKGVARAETAQAVIRSIDIAVEHALSGQASGIVTNPIQKSALTQTGFSFPGHTEYLAELTKEVALDGDRLRGPVMMLVGPDLRTAPVTIHVSVAKAASELTPEKIYHCARVCHEALRHDFGIEKPRLAISGLNPHAGEAGTIGREDMQTILPAVRRLQGDSIDAFGPVPADALFNPRARATYDAAICMLHDQALIPVKTINFDEAVNVTLGLPIVRTSPDHGTALDIAGKGIADERSLLAAILLADELASRRNRAASVSPRA